MTDLYRSVYNDLRWYFNDSAAAFGFKSSFGSFESTLNRGGVEYTPATPDENMSDGLLASAGKHRRIETILRSLSPETRASLDAVYNSEHRYPAHLRVIYGAKTGLALFSSHLDSLDHLVKLAEKKLTKKLSDEERTFLFLVGDDIKQLWNQIHQQYLTAKQAHLNQAAIDKQKKLLVYFRDQACKA